jgi:Flp pilus assembly protein TadD
MWAFTGLGVVAFSLLAVAARTGENLPAERTESGTERRVGRGLGARGAVGAIVAIVLALSLALPGIASRYVSAAYRAYGEGSVDVALKRLDRAAELNFLSAEPLIAKGVIARRSGRPDVALDAFAESVEREPGNWFARFELGMSLEQDRHRRAAMRQLGVAHRLNPRQPELLRVLAVMRHGGSIDPAAVEHALNSQLTDRLRPLPRPSQ